MSRIRQKKFKAFIHRVEGKEDVFSGNSQWNTEDLRNVIVYNLQDLSLARAGNRYYLLDAFKWNTTPQGADYWVERFNGAQPLTQEDKQFMKELCLYHGYNSRPLGNSSEQSPSF